MLDIEDMDDRALRFAMNHEGTCTNPQNAKGMCHAMSKLFNQLHPETAIVMLAGFKGDASKSTWKNHPPSQYRHVVVLVEGIYYDFTARQYHPDHSVPRALTRAEMEAEWEEIVI